MSYWKLPLWNSMSHVVCPRGPSWGPSFYINMSDFTQFINICKVVLYTYTILLVTDNNLDIIKQSDSESAQHWFKCN